MKSPSHLLLVLTGPAWHLKSKPHSETTTNNNFEKQRWCERVFLARFQNNPKATTTRMVIRTPRNRRTNRQHREISRCKRSFPVIERRKAASSSHLQEEEQQSAFLNLVFSLHSKGSASKTDFPQISSEVKLKALPFPTPSRAHASIKIRHEKRGKPKNPRPNADNRTQGRTLGVITWFIALHLFPRPSTSLFAPCRIF